jgi:hypothetical protein
MQVWETLYEAAATEPDADKIPEKVRLARQAIEARLRGQVSVEECARLINAAEHLSTLECEARDWPRTDKA